MRFAKRDGGLIVCGNAFDAETLQVVDAEFGHQPSGLPAFPLIICDPPYGRIVREAWDRADYLAWFDHCATAAAPDATVALWGGIGKPGHRPFVEFAAKVESLFPGWQIKNWVTWAKRRAYGVQDNYLFTREECLIITRGRPVFNVPLLDTKRGYAGFDPEHPAHSEYRRRTNVWTDITELFRGKVHPCQKPDKLYQVLIATHTNPGDAVYDPCAGSGTTWRAAQALGRRACIVEADERYLVAAGLAP